MVEHIAMRAALRVPVARARTRGFAAPAFRPGDVFHHRHIGPSAAEQEAMLKSLGCKDVSELLKQTVPEHIRRPLPIEVEALTENGAMERLKAMVSTNAEATSFLGQGYHGTKVPAPVLRHVLSNPAWYTAYTPYQAEISQGRMEALFNFQTGICELTGMEVANASMLDESTSAAEAVQMCMRLRRLKGVRGKVLLDLNVHPQTIDIIRERAKYLDLEIVVGDVTKMTITDNVVCAMGQYPGTDGKVKDYKATAEALHAKKSYLILGTDPLALTLLHPPAKMGADIVRWPARGVLRDAQGVRAQHARPHHRLVEGRAGQPGHAPDAADQRAAHPPGQGDVERVHGAGPARVHVQHVHVLPRPGGASADRARREALPAAGHEQHPGPGLPGDHE